MPNIYSKSDRYVTTKHRNRILVHIFCLIFVLTRVFLQVVELISGGAQIAVTNENKMHYLNLLAQYRLASQVRDEVEHFLKGKESSTAAVCHFCQVR